MKFKVIKLNFRKFDKVKILLESEPLPISPVICPSNIHPRCHQFYIPTYEGQEECLLCTQYRKEQTPRKVLTIYVDKLE